MEDPSTQTPRPTPRPQLCLDEFLTAIATLLIPTAAILILTGILAACVMIVTRWIWPYYRHKRTRPLLERRSSGTYELNEIYTNPGHNTI